MKLRFSNLLCIPRRLHVKMPRGCYFSARVGKTASFSPAWNCGPTFASKMFFGKRSSNATSKTRDRNMISQSGTRRRCDSKLATESRLTLHPRSWSRVAKVAWDQPLLTRHLRTWGPIRFIAGFATSRHGSEMGKITCVHTHTEKPCNWPEIRRSILCKLSARTDVDCFSHLK